MKRSEIKNLAIINAAKKLFLAQGFSATTMSDIARKAEVSSRTLYLHFPKKELLFQAVLKAHWISLAPLEKNALSDNASPKEVLEKFGMELLDFMYSEETQALYRLLVAESHRFSNLCEGLIKEGKGPLTRALIHYLDNLVQKKVLVIEDTSLAASQFMGLLKEDQFWPYMLGFIPALDHSKSKKIVKLAVELFLKND